MRVETRVDINEKCLLLYDFNQNWNFSTNFSRTPQYHISWNSFSGFLLLHVDGQADKQTGMAKLIGAVLKLGCECAINVRPTT
jgi:hypothetical protein